MRRPRQHHARRSALLAALLVAVIGGGLLSLHFYQTKQEEKELENWLEEDAYDPAARSSVYYDGRWYQLRDDLDTYLVMGIDKTGETKYGDEDSLFNNQQADFLVLMIADRSDKTYTALHLNRDTMTEIQRLGLAGRVTGTYTAQLALAHTYGSGGRDSCRNTVKAVSRLLYDTPIDHYFALTMDSIPVLNDLVGGVTVHIDEDLTPADPAFVPGADVHLEGDQALAFVRARRNVSDGTNLSRMNRQRTYLDALYTQLKTKLNTGNRFALTVADKLSPYLTSDLITQEFADLLERLKDYEFRGYETTRGNAVSDGEFIEFHIDEEALQKQVINLFYEPK